MRQLCYAGVLLLTGFVSASFAHEVRPGYLELTQTAPDTYELYFKVPAAGERRLRLRPVFPEHCKAVAPSAAYSVNGVYTERATLRCRTDLTGETITIEGLSSTLTDVLVRCRRLDGTVQVVRLTPAAPSFVVDASPSVSEVAMTYLGIGVEHIIFGIDHLLFVLALLLLVEGWRKLVMTITAFTLAHSVTLAAAVLGWVYVPQQPVEAVIALSIVFVASEILAVQRGRTSLTQSRP